MTLELIYFESMLRSHVSKVTGPEPDTRSTRFSNLRAHLLLSAVLLCEPFILIQLEASSFSDLDQLYEIIMWSRRGASKLQVVVYRNLLSVVVRPWTMRRLGLKPLMGEFFFF